MRVPVISPPRETVFEDTPIMITSHRPGHEVVLYTIDAPHDFKINPFATKTEQNNQVCSHAWRPLICVARLFQKHQPSIPSCLKLPAPSLMIL